MRPDFRSLLRDRVPVFDGGMGTSIQFAAPPLADFGGHEGPNEWLNLTRPELIEAIHGEFLDAGCDVVETNSFGAFAVVLDEYGVGDEARRLARAAAVIARRAVDARAGDGRPRFAAGSMGPGTKLPSLGHIALPELAAAYEPLAEGLIEGGCDLLLIETCQDPLQARAAMLAVRRALARQGRDLPIGVQFTVEKTGTMLLGTEPLAALTALLPLRPDFVGLNCATGPEAMREHVRVLCRHSPVPVSVIPNAGLPSNVDGRMVYDLEPERFAETLAAFVEEFGVGLVGGCCGTRPEHLRALVDRLGERPAPRRRPAPLHALSSLYQAVELDQDPRPLLVGERTNANGSRLFRELLQAGDWEEMTTMAAGQQAEGAHVLDVSLAYVGRDEVADTAEYARRLNTAIQIPVMIDSTDPAAIAAALERLGGRCIVNSINLEDGEARAREVLALCRDHGAAVVALCIDEQGMARTPELKLAVARRLVDLAAEYGLGPEDMLFDALTFTLASGDAEYRDSAQQTLAGLRLIKREIPGARTILGLSNVSFGLKPRMRRVLNSVFLEMAVDAGLDAAILHAGKILAGPSLPADLRDSCRRLIEDDRRDGDPLAALLEADAPPLEAEAAARDAGLPVDERLRRRIVEGRAGGIAADLDEALRDTDALAIINGVLLDGMQEVGRLFGAGRLQLPFVLKSAETMKAAVGHLEPHMERSASTSRGRFVIATVKGDVHDIGKNLVDIILTNNGFRVDNLGIKIPVEQIIEVVRREQPLAVGMSGLLVKSTVVMKENLEAMAAAGLDLPVVLGGAALTKRYVEADLRRVYPGPVYYARDAFDGLSLVETLAAGEIPSAAVREPDELPVGVAADEAAAEFAPLPPVEPIPTPPFWGVRTVGDIDMTEVWRLLNRPALVKGRWGYTRAGLSHEDYRRLERAEIEPALARLERSAREEGWLQPSVAYGWFPVRAEDDRLWIYAGPEAGEPRWHLDFPPPGTHSRRCLADYFRADGAHDVLGVMAVTMGSDASRHTAALMAADDYSGYLLAHGFAVESAEALAEHWHQVMRELGIADDDAADPAGIVRGGYRGRRYSFGYPACPELGDQRLLAEMLDWKRIGLELTESCQLDPEHSVTALVVHHPEAAYFSV